MLLPMREFLGRWRTQRWLLWLEAGQGALYLSTGGAGPGRRAWRLVASCARDDTDHAALIRELLASVRPAWWATLDVVLGSRVAPALSVELGRDELPARVEREFVQQRFVQAWGEGGSAGWVLRSAPGRGGTATLVFGCPGELRLALEEQARARGLRLRSTQPVLAWIERQHLPDAEGVAAGETGAEHLWLVAQETDRCVALVREASGRQCVVTLQELSTHEALEQLHTQLTRWEKRLGIASEGPVWLYGRTERVEPKRGAGRWMRCVTLLPQAVDAQLSPAQDLKLVEP